MDGMGQGSQDSQAGHDLDRKLSRTEASRAVTGLGWRYVLGDLRTEVLTGSLPLAADVAARAAAPARPGPGVLVPADGRAAPAA